MSAIILNPFISFPTLDVFSSKLLHVQNVQTAGTNGGSSTADTFVTIDLNTVLTNEISGASLATNEITLPAGDYYTEIISPCYRGLENFARLYDVTGAAALLIGSSDYRDNAAGNTDPETGKSYISGRFTLSVQSDIKLEHSVDNSFATQGFGFAANGGGLVRNQEVFADVLIWGLG